MIKIIYDKQKAIQEKQEVDAANKKLYRPLQIYVCFVGCIVILAIISFCFTTTGVINNVWIGLLITIAIFLSIGFLFLHSTILDKKRWYSANVKYYLAIKNKTAKQHKVFSVYGRGLLMGYQLDVLTENKKHKERWKGVMIPWPEACRGISVETVDLINNKYLIPLDNQICELENQLRELKEGALDYNDYLSNQKAAK